MDRLATVGRLSILCAALAGNYAFADVVTEDQKIDSGWQVAVSGDTAVLGAPRADSFKGAAYIFEPNSVTGLWVQVKKLQPADLESTTQFGEAVVIDGDIAVVGIPRANANTGAAYVFERNAGGPNMWGQVAKLEPSIALEGVVFFGYSLDVDGERIIVGAPYAATAYIFERQADGGWSETSRLDGFPVDYGMGFVAEDFFGVDVGIAGDTAVVGAATASIGTIFSPIFDVGAAHVFAYEAGSWTHVKKLDTGTLQGGARFGQHVAIDAHTIIVGAYLWDDPLSENSGGAWVFDRDLGGPNNWGEAQKLTAADVVGGDFFGTDVSIDVDLAVVGAQRTNSFTGAAYVFDRHSSWGEVKKLVASNAAPVHDFGADTAISQGTVFIGAPPGSAYVYGVTADNANQPPEITGLLDPLVLEGNTIGGFDAAGLTAAAAGVTTVDSDAGPLPVMLTNDAPPILPLGDTTVEWTASDGEDTDTATHIVTVEDTTGPSLVLPGDITEVGLSPLGHSVAFGASAADIVDPAPALTCVPASGALFPLGTTTVDCSALDASGNETASSFDVTLTVGEITFDGFLAKIVAMEFSKGLENSLSAKVRAARGHLAAGAIGDAIGSLNALVNEIDSLEGKKLTTGEADALRLCANALIAGLMELS